MTIKPILPVEVVRDEDGWFTHPQYFTEPEWEEVDNFTREEFGSYCAERGIETATTDMESDDSEMHERYCEEGQVECTAWTPSKPVGDGWFMLSIHDTEDGPICVWGRRTEEPFVTEAVAAVSEPDLFSEQPAQHEAESALQSLSHFTLRSFDQLMRYEDGRTPLYLTEEQYNAIRDLVAHASAQPAAPQCDHQWTDDGEHLLICTECGAQEDHDPKWRDMATAPRDGTMLRLLVEFTDHSTEDAEQAPTIGANNFDNGGEDHWQFAGWCWTHDHFTEGKGEPVGWLPMLEDPRRTAAAANGVKSDE